MRGATMRNWLAKCGLSREQFSELMTEWAQCNALERHFAAQIERRVPGQLALHSLRRAGAGLEEHA